MPYYYAWKKSLDIFTCLLIFWCFLSCKTLKHNDFDNYQSNISTNLSTSTKKASKKNDLILEIEKASYNSLTSVIEKIQENPASLEGDYKFYLYLASLLMNELYPYNKMKWKVPKYSKKNEYIEGFESVKKGEYPYNMQKNDFFSTIIPSFLLLKPNFPKMFKDDALERIEKAKTQNTLSPLPYYLEGLFYEKEYNILKAYNAYKKAYFLDASFYPALLKYAKLSNSLGDADEAIATLKKLPLEYQDKEETLFLNAFSYIGKKDWEKANPYIDRILSVYIQEGEGLFERVKLLLEKGEYMKANSLLNIYTTKNKTDKTYLLLKARITKEWNKNDKNAIQYLSQAYTYYPDDYEVLLACTNMCFDANTNIQGNMAEDFIAKILEIDKDNVQTIKLLLKREIKNENWVEAVNIGVNLVKRAKTNENQELLVKAYLGNKQYSEALSIARQLYNSESSPSNELFSDYLEALYKTNNIASLNNIINQNINTSKGEKKSILYYYSALLTSKNSLSHLSLLRSALLTNPRNEDALFAMYQWYFLSKDYRNAQFYLKQAIGIEGGNNKNYLRLYENLNQLLGL
ncbi:MAG: tetratricopeptide repeat protein [Treponema sp.]